MITDYVEFPSDSESGDFDPSLSESPEIIRPPREAPFTFPSGPSPTPTTIPTDSSKYNDTYQYIVGSLRETGQKLKLGEIQPQITKDIPKLSGPGSSFNVGEMLGEALNGVSRILDSFYHYYKNAPEKDKRYILEKILWFPDTVKTLLDAVAVDIFAKNLGRFLSGSLDTLDAIKGRIGDFTSSDPKSIEDIELQIKKIKLIADTVSKNPIVDFVSMVTPIGNLSRIYGWLSGSKDNKDALENKNGGCFNCGLMRFVIIVILIVLIIVVISNIMISYKDSSSKYNTMALPPAVPTPPANFV